MLLHKTPNRTKFCGDRVKNAGDIRDREFVLPEKVDQISPKILGDATPKTSNHAKFHRDLSNQLGDKGWSEKNFHTHTMLHTHGILTT